MLELSRRRRRSATPGGLISTRRASSAMLIRPELCSRSSKVTSTSSRGPTLASEADMVISCCIEGRAASRPLNQNRLEPGKASFRQCRGWGCSSVARHREVQMSTTRIHTGIGVGQGTAIYVAAILGAGILALPSLAAKVAGPASILSWVGLVLLSIPMAATFAALGARYPDGGGVATFVTKAFRRRASRSG